MPATDELSADERAALRDQRTTDRRQRAAVVFDPMCHLHRHERRAHQRPYRLTGRPAGDPRRPLTIGDLTAIAEPSAGLLIGLPQRDRHNDAYGLCDFGVALATPISHRRAAVPGVCYGGDA